MMVWTHVAAFLLGYVVHVFLARSASHNAYLRVAWAWWELNVALRYETAHIQHVLDYMGLDVQLIDKQQVAKAAAATCSALAALGFVRKSRAIQTKAFEALS